MIAGDGRACLKDNGKAVGRLRAGGELLLSDYTYADSTELGACTSSWLRWPRWLGFLGLGC